MNEIIKLLSKYGTFFLFVFLQIISFFLVINYNQTQKDIFLHSSSYYADFIDGKVAKWRNYLTLQEANDSLSAYNARLLEMFINTKEPLPPFGQEGQYALIPARIIKNTFRLRNNHITLDKGKKDGVKKGMGVISEKGILGIITHVSQNLSHGISILNGQNRISCTIKGYAYPGVLVWNNNNPKYMTLMSIPKYVSISVGDSIITNGYSTIFPPDILVGRISSFEVGEGLSDYVITVELSEDVRNAKIGYIIKNQLAEEQKMLENTIDE